MMQNLELANTAPRSPPIPARNPARSPIVEASNPLHSWQATDPSMGRSDRDFNTRSPQHSKSPKQPEPLSSKLNSSMQAPSSPTHTLRTSSPTQKRASDLSFGGSSLRYSSSSYASSTTSSGGWSSPATPLIYHQPLATAKRNVPLPGTLEVREPYKVSDEYGLSLLPPPALAQTERPTSRSTLSHYPAIQSDFVKLHRSSTTSSQRAAFEKEAFRNSAVLCDV
jgi:hypothetical protein